MGLSERKNKQRIGDDPRNTKWSKNQSNPGFKILSSMGWSHSSKSLINPSNSLEAVPSSWKRLPGSQLPVIKSNTSGLGSNPNQTPSSSYLFGSPRFVPSSQSILSVETEVKSIENGSNSSAPISILTGTENSGGGFDDLLRRLNQPKKVNTESNLEIDKSSKLIEESNSMNDSFVLVSPDNGKNNFIQKDKNPKTIRSIIRNSNSNLSHKVRKRVRILDTFHDSKQDLNFKTSLTEVDQQQPKLKKIKKNHQNSPEPIKSDHQIKKNHIDQIEKDLSSNHKIRNSLISNLTQIKKADFSFGENKNQPIATKKIPLESASIPVRLNISRPINPRVASRAKYINAKKLASSENSAAMAEILGIPPPDVST